MSFRDEAAERRGPPGPIAVELGAHSASQLYADLEGNLVGVFASTFLVLAENAHVELVISFPDRNSLRAAGVVHFVRTAGVDQLPGLGVSFSEIAAEDLEVLTQFARVRPPMLHDA